MGNDDNQCTGERVLLPDKLDLPNEDKSEMQNAYMFISDFLRSKEDKHLNHNSLEALKAMEMLWQGESLNYKKNNHELNFSNPELAINGELLLKNLG